MPSGDKMRKVSKGEKHKNLAVLEETPRPNTFFFHQHFQTATVALSRAPENVG